MMHKAWLKMLESFSHGIEDEKKLENALKKTLRKLLRKADTNFPPLEFEKYKAKDFMVYLLSLQKEKEKTEHSVIQREEIWGFPFMTTLWHKTE
jgi:hypothetical protein